MHSFNQVDNYTDNRQKEILWELLANPAEAGHTHKQALEQLVQQYPQSGVLQVLLARADYSRDASRTAVYFNSRALYKIINNPGGLAAADPETITYTQAKRVIERNTAGATATGYNEVSKNEFKQAEVPLLTKPGQEIVTEAPFAKTEEEEAQPYILPEEVVEEPVAETEYTEPEQLPEYRQEHTPAPSTETILQAHSPADTSYENFLFGSGVAVNDTDTDTTVNKEDTIRFFTPDIQPEKEYFREDIDDEIYDEIVGIENIGFGSVNSFSERNIQPEAPAPVTIEEVAHDNPTQVTEYPAEVPVTEPDSPAYENTGTAVSQEPVAASAVNIQDEPVWHNQDLSRYHDDTLPYSFMWWLNKTRKEHAGTFQPYAVNPVYAKENNNTDALQQQYKENIFNQTSINSIAAGDNLPPIKFDHNRKEDIIIERFIHSEPQIKPQAADKLDNENKARQSAEDRHELVTETLARIYTDQMLYPKAIATYQKLILKFPEKNAYFAAQIKELQKRTY